MITFVIVLFILVLIIYFFFRLDSFGAVPVGESLERIKKSTAYKSGKFYNLEETVMLAKGASYPVLIKNQFFKNTKNREPQSALPVVKRKLDNVSDDDVHITWFGHSSVLIQLRGKNILIDPVFSKRTSPVQFIGSKNFKGTDAYSVNDLPSIDIVLISHDHYDHLDYHTMKILGPSVKKFYTSLGVGASLEKWGIDKNKITELDWWESISIDDDTQLTAVPARHFSGRSLTNRNYSLWSSFILKSKSYNLFLGADSGYGKHFKEIGEKYGPFDLTMLEAGQYNDFWPSIHMMPEQTVQAHIDLKGKVLLPIHWGKFSLAWHDWNEPIERVAKKSGELNIQLTTPMIGEEIILSKTIPQSQWWRT